VLVNHGGATGEDIFLLAQEMSSSVLQRFGIALQPEVLIV
jgi:UDP-N-acetylenolpyruvoylglucosamine reductase